MSIRPVKEVHAATPTVEGAGVKLHRAFGFGKTEEFDPFLLLDDFRNDDPDDYLAGFPWHPHRGIETVTYVLAGDVEHNDSLGSRGSLGAGDVQWMTAGSGILHQEMPRGDAKGRMHGFQLWANLPASRKMTAPRYQDVTAAEIPELTDDDGTHVRVVCGDFRGTRGPVEGIATDPTYLGRMGSRPVSARRFRWRSAAMHSRTSSTAPARSARRQTRGPSRPTSSDRISRSAPPPWATAHSCSSTQATRSLFRQAKKASASWLVSGQPLREPVAWYGPIVMNTREELVQAKNDLDNGTFIKGG